MNKGKSDYEAKKQEKERVREKERREAKLQNTKSSFIKYALWVLVIILVIYGIVLLVRAGGPEGEDFSVAYEIQGRDHIQEGAEHPPYNSNPPSSGWHYASPARAGAHDEPLEDERVMHNLEHGEIWIAYHPEISEEAQSVLEEFAGQYVVVSPRPENEGDISLVAWGRVDTFDLEDGDVDRERIEDFIKRYDNRGPENVRRVQPSHTF